MSCLLETWRAKGGGPMSELALLACLFIYQGEALSHRGRKMRVAGKIPEACVAEKD